MSNTVNDIFHPTGVSTEERNTEVYKVSYKNGKNGVYNSIIRFIPFYKNTNKNIMQKYTSFIKNPISQKGMYVDDPSTIGQKSPSSELFFALMNSKVDAYMSLARNYLSSKKNCAALIQIIKDEQHPELEGKIKVFVFGKTILDKITNEQNPQIPGQKGIIPFDPINGRYFAISCCKKDNYNNYDNSMFFDNKDQSGNILPSGMWYENPATGKLEVVNENTNPQDLISYLSKNSPDLSKYDYQEWTEEQAKHVNETCNIINTYISTGSFQSAPGAAMPNQNNFMQPANAGNMQAVNNVINSVPQQNVTFPGANSTPVGISIPGLQQSTQVPPTPSAQPATPPTPSVPPTPSIGGFVPTQPSAAPQATTPPATSAPVVPNLTPSAPPSQSTEQQAVAGVNMDDILNQL